jgi:hypothetical protein
MRFTRRQFPVKLAYSTTINRAQGKTLDRVCVDLRTPVFSHGQLYTALSRVRTINDVAILLKPPDNQDAALAQSSSSTRSVLNIVHQELLNNDDNQRRRHDAAQASQQLTTTQQQHEQQLQEARLTPLSPPEQQQPQWEWGLDDVDVDETSANQAAPEATERAQMHFMPHLRERHI